MNWIRLQFNLIENGVRSERKRNSNAVLDHVRSLAFGSRWPFAQNEKKDLIE